MNTTKTRAKKDAIAEDEAAFEQGYTVMQVPLELAPVVRQLIALMEEKNQCRFLSRDTPYIEQSGHSIVAASRWSPKEIFMNVPPTDGIRVAVTDLEQLVVEIFKAVPLPADHAQLIASKLVECDLRGVVSHGTLQVNRYVRSFQDGTVNPNPQIRILKEGPTTAALSGDGGLGYLVATKGMEMAIAKAQEFGIGAATSTYHGHLGSTGNYARMAMRADLIGISTSGRNASDHYNRDSTIRGSIQGSPPLAFGMPSGEGKPTFLLDFASHYAIDDETFLKYPPVFIKAIGVSHVGNILSGTLGGQMLKEFSRGNIEFTGADQSGFFLALDVNCFSDLDAFKADMDHLMDEASRMKPLPSFDESFLPGGKELARETEYRRDGVPISAQAVEGLEEVAEEFSIATPW